MTIWLSNVDRNAVNALSSDSVVVGCGGVVDVDVGVGSGERRVIDGLSVSLALFIIELHTLWRWRASVLIQIVL